MCIPESRFTFVPMIRRELSSPQSASTALYSDSMKQHENPSLSNLFALMDVNGDGKLTKNEFTNGILGIEHWDITEIEVSRMFDSIDVENKGYITRFEFQKAAYRWRWLRSVASVACASRSNRFVVPSDYDYTKPTCENYQGPPGLFYGDFIKIREERDYTFHTNYTESRQIWQDMAVKSCLGRTEAQARPWVVYTCGPMGVGKGHVLSWLSKQGLFPLEYIVHADPDFFKRIMPEWTGYLAAAAARESESPDSKEIAAGTACHVESGYLQEIAMEAAMSERQHVWVDGSLSDGNWYSKVFDDHRKRFPHYRIAIISITASEATVRSRIAKRSLETGRTIPESQIVRSLQSPEESIRLLAPKTDLVIRIINESSIVLKCVEDHSGNWYRGLHKHFGVISHQHPHFPDWLGPLYFEDTSLVGYPLEVIRFPLEPLTAARSIETIKSGMLVKKGSKMQNWKTRWFILQPGRLIYCSKTLTIKGECLITPFTTVECTNCVEVVDEIPKLTKSPSSSSFLFSRNTEYTFTIHSVKTDGSSISIMIDAGSAENQTSWTEAIKSEIKNAKKYENALLGYYKNSHTTIKFTQNATFNSPMLRAYLARDPDFKMITSKLQIVDMERAGRDLMGMPENTTHYRWIYPTREMREDQLDQIDISDPDIMLLRFGGFVNYDLDGRVIGVRAVTENKTQHMLMFGAPEFLRPEDVDRLHAGDRWMRATSPMMKEHGVKYLTFILPQEELPSRRFPPAFAFLFREPTDPSDPRDRYFSPVTEY